MRKEDAPRSGWYPDPEGRMNLRYWDGLDWTEARRAPPSNAELQSYESQQAQALLQAPVEHRSHIPPVTSATSATPAPDASHMIEEVRRATRSEIDRAADQFTRRAKAIQREVTPLISEYTNRIVKWVRFAAVVAVVLLVAYFVFQVVAQASLFEWISDQIDKFTDESSGAARVGRAFVGSA